MKKKAVKATKRQKPEDVRTGSLGIGDAYAYGISALVEESKNKKGSDDDSWLGKEKETLDPTKYVDSKKLHKTK